MGQDAAARAVAARGRGAAMSEGLLDEIAAGARRVLDENWLGASTLPSRTLYPHQWSWDSAFIAIGRSWYDEARAQQELRSLLLQRQVFRLQ